MDICLEDSLFSPQLWQLSFWSGPSFSDLVKKSKQPERVGMLGLMLGSPLFLFFLQSAGDNPLAESRVSEMSMNGSYVVEVDPQVVQVTSDLKRPENAL